MNAYEIITNLIINRECDKASAVAILEDGELANDLGWHPEDTEEAYAVLMGGARLPYKCKVELFKWCLQECGTKREALIKAHALFNLNAADCEGELGSDEAAFKEAYEPLAVTQKA